jgi:hypothetical protein
MPTPMTLIQPEGLRVSLPGVNVLAPPALTEDYLAIDWTWPKIERLHAKGKVSASSIPSGAGSITFPFPALSTAPLALIVPLTPGTTIHRDELVVSGATSSSGGILFFSWRVPYSWRTTLSTVDLTASATNVLQSFDWAFFVFRNQT